MRAAAFVAAVILCGAEISLRVYGSDELLNGGEG